MWNRLTRLEMAAFIPQRELTRYSFVLSSQALDNFVGFRQPAISLFHLPVLQIFQIDKIQNCPPKMQPYIWKLGAYLNKGFLIIPTYFMRSQILFLPIQLVMTFHYSPMWTLTSSDIYFYPQIYGPAAYFWLQTALFLVCH